MLDNNQYRDYATNKSLYHLTKQATRQETVRKCHLQFPSQYIGKLTYEPLDYAISEWSQLSFVSKEKKLPDRSSYPEL